MPLHRRDFLKMGGVAAAAAVLPRSLAAAPLPSDDPADYSIRIGTGLVELAPGRIVSITTYNGAFPGPLLRFREGRPVIVDLDNDTDTPEQLHWHGQHVPADVDGAAEEGTPFIPAHGRRRIRFTPGPAGFRFYHTHVRAGGDLARGTYGGQAGPVYIEPARDPGAYDREVFLVLKEFEPEFSRGGDMAMDFLAPATQDPALRQAGESAMRASLARGLPHGYEVGYRAFSINGRMLGHNDPIRVKAGDRVLFHVLNASATEIRSLALPGHTFRIVALDGNPVPNRVDVPALWLGTAERISALVEMREPGVWVMGDLADDDRSRGMGTVVEYAGRTGTPVWKAPPAAHWDYTRFGRASRAALPDETLEMTFAKRNAADHGFNQWTVNGTPFSARTGPSVRLRRGRRYRLRLRNASDDLHPIHLHRHTFELTSLAGRQTSGVMKDVVMLGGYQQMELDFVADNPGPTLFHCHQQLHMDFGFMALFDYV